MKRRDLERHLAAHGAELAREGSRHNVWRHDAATSTMPRHREIAPTLARAICRQLQIPDPLNR